MEGVDCFVLVPNYNGRIKGYLEDCLTSILKSGRNSRNTSFATMVVDDHSSDSSEELIMKYVTRKGAKTFPFYYLQTGRNLDVTGAYNLGISRILNCFPDVKCIVTLDSDTVIDEDFLSALVKAAKTSTSRTGMFATNQFFLADGKRTNRHRSTGHFVTPDGDTWDRGYNDSGTGREKILGPCLSGALLKTSMLRDVGLMMPEYRHYHTCTELGLRAQIRGWGVEFVGAARMWHAGLRPSERTIDNEVPRVWNILRFFPQNEIENSISLFEQGETGGAGRDQLHRFVEAARRTCPPVYPMAEGKRRVYRQLIQPNRRPDI
jgi:GT2 family glycosyltransferase